MKFKTVQPEFHLISRYSVNQVWRYWKQGEPSEVLDKNVTGQCPSQELIRCIQIGLLCIQEEPSERPNMASVILMLRSPSITMDAPSAPIVFFQSATRTDGQTSLTENYGMAMSENVESMITSTIEE